MPIGGWIHLNVGLEVEFVPEFRSTFPTRQPSLLSHILIYFIGT
jgi:hypothetical protein